MRALFCFIFILLQVFLSGCKSGYLKENGVWSYVTQNEASGRKVNDLNADSETFTVLKNNQYAKDKNTVFFNGNIIEDAKSGSFEVINDYGYSKDENYVFVAIDKVIGANPKTFVYLDFPYSKDDKYIYCGTLPMFVKNIEEFKVMQRGSGMISESTDYFIRSNPSYGFIDPIKYPGVMYSTGRGETNDQKFEGYRLVNSK